MRTILLVVALGVAVPARAGDRRWTATDWAMGAAFVAAVVSDYGQTRYVLAHHPAVYETNPLLGRDPSDARLLTVCVGAVAVHAAVAVALPTKWRRYWQLVTVTAAFTNDYGIAVAHGGLRFSF